MERRGRTVCGCVLQSTGLAVMAQSNDHKSRDLSTALAALGVIATIATMSVISMLRIVDHFRPKVGDIITFDPAKKASPDSDPRITVTAAGSPSTAWCILDASTMRKSDGSLIIEATRPGPIFIYRVHWAGGPTSDAQTSCGASVNLLLSEVQITSLKLAATR